VLFPRGARSHPVTVSVVNGTAAVRRMAKSAFLAPRCRDGATWLAGASRPAHGACACWHASVIGSSLRVDSVSVRQPHNAHEKSPVNRREVAWLFGPPHLCGSGVPRDFSAPGGSNEMRPHLPRPEAGNQKPWIGYINLYSPRNGSNTKNTATNKHKYKQNENNDLVYQQ